MAAAHGGHEGHVPVGGDRRALVLSGLLTGAYFVIELGLGLSSGSVAVVSDAFDTFSAVGGVLIALVAQRLSERPATPEHTFGWGRAEIIGALFNGLFLAIMALYVLWMGAMRLMEPVGLSTAVMLYAAFGGIVTEVIAFWLLYERQKENLNMKGAFWHIVQTFIGSLIHHRVRSGRPPHRLGCNRPHSGHGLRPRSLLGVVEHHPLGLAHPAAEHARGARHQRGDRHPGGH
jgi:cobalt-zinc-cadmium efflux system protein